MASSALWLIISMKGGGCRWWWLHLEPPSVGLSATHTLWGHGMIPIRPGCCVSMQGCLVHKHLSSHPCPVGGSGRSFFPYAPLNTLPPPLPSLGSLVEGGVHLPILGHGDCVCFLYCIALWGLEKLANVCTRYLTDTKHYFLFHCFPASPFSLLTPLQQVSCALFPAVDLFRRSRAFKELCASPAPGKQRKKLALAVFWKVRGDAHKMIVFIYGRVGVPP